MKQKEIWMIITEFVLVKIIQKMLSVPIQECARHKRKFSFDITITTAKRK